MLTIRTEYVTNASGKGQIRATGHGRQRTVTYAHSKSVEWNHGAGCGALVNVLTNAEQQSKLRHPSGKRRVEESCVEEGRNFYIDV